MEENSFIYKENTRKRENGDYFLYVVLFGSHLEYPVPNWTPTVVYILQQKKHKKIIEEK